ncbi:MAG: DUF3124 domain-containing protein [Acidobacteriota bacterium]|nr:DUF3124 domain-containing protein [Acidobacteriota bacterium]
MKHSLRIILFFWLAMNAFAISAATGNLSRGQLLYVPAYSHIYSGDEDRPFLLTVTLSIRNIDPGRKIHIDRVEYMATSGTLLKNYIEKTVELQPLASMRIVIPMKDKAGGSGASFLVEWSANAPTNPPIVEAIMIGTQAQQGISFVSRAREITRRQK